MIFTVEEMNLMKAFDHSNRRSAAFSIMSSLPSIQDEELKESCRRMAEKVKRMSDAEFAAVDFTVYGEDDYE